MNDNDCYNIEYEKFLYLICDHIADPVGKYIAETGDKNPVVLCIVTGVGMDDKTGEPLLDIATQPMSIEQFNEFKNEFTMPDGGPLSVSDQIASRIGKIDNGFQCVIFADGKQILESIDSPEMIN